MSTTSASHRAAMPGASSEATLRRLAELAADFGAEPIAAGARSIAERVAEGRFYAACVGQFKRGKSTLLNALTGHSVLPTAVVPVTAVPTVIRHGDRVLARVRLQSGELWNEIPMDAVAEYVSEEKNPENAKGVTGVEIFVPSPLLQSGMCLVDTPGLGSVFPGNTAATHAFVPHIDAAIVVIGADPPISAEELQLVETVARNVRDLFFVLNKADRTSDSERAAALEFAREILAKRLERAAPRIFEVSALERLEQRGAQRDWSELVRALSELVSGSGRSLVHEAAQRAIRRSANQLLAVIKEERDALDRPLEGSEARITALRKILRESENDARDLAVLLTAEQQRLSATFAERRARFLKEAQPRALQQLQDRLPSLSRIHSGPAHRRALNHLAQEIVYSELAPWLQGEAEFAETAFRQTTARFVELGNSFLNRLAATGMPDLESLPEELEQTRGLRVQSRFQFHVIERVAAPASPLLFVSDLVRAGLGWREGIVRDAMEFVGQLLEVNSSRVQSDVDERLRGSRRKLGAEITALLTEGSTIAARALAHARAAQAAGAPAVVKARARIDSAEREVRSFL
jgi:GTP-binding protein EngB required for normal cell division